MDDQYGRRAHLLGRSRFDEGIREFEAPTGSRALACALAGRREEATRILEAEPHVTYLDPPALAALGQTDRAFRALDELYREHWGEMTLLAADPLYDPLRVDPRFAVLLRKIGLS